MTGLGIAVPEQEWALLHSPQRFATWLLDPASYVRGSAQAMQDHARPDETPNPKHSG